MGTDRMAVVDEPLRVHGIHDLRIVDASVTPQNISADLNGPTQMIATRAANFMRNFIVRTEQHMPRVSEGAHSYSRRPVSS